MTVQLRIGRKLLEAVHADLSRPHAHAAERVTFLSCRPSEIAAAGLLLIGVGVHPVAEEDYERDLTVGAMLGPGAFRQILQFAYNTSVTVFHVHRHEHHGRPWFSNFDLEEAKKYMPDFSKVRPGFPHGIIVLSHDSAAGLVWLPPSGVVRLSRITITGYPMQEIWNES